jgi:hypothetical protein
MSALLVEKRPKLLTIHGHFDSALVAARAKSSRASMKPSSSILETERKLKKHHDVVEAGRGDTRVHGGAYSPLRTADSSTLSGRVQVDENEVGIGLGAVPGPHQHGSSFKSVTANLYRAVRMIFTSRFCYQMSVCSWPSPRMEQKIAKVET